MHGRIVAIIEHQLVDNERDNFGADGGQAMKEGTEDQVDGLFCRKLRLADGMGG